MLREKEPFRKIDLRAMIVFTFYAKKKQTINYRSANYEKKKKNNKMKE